MLNCLPADLFLQFLFVFVELSNTISMKPVESKTIILMNYTKIKQ